MGKGNRGFKPQGIMNPILMARLSRPVHTEKTTRVRLDRELRPSWEEVKGVVFKKQTSTAEFLEKWENDHYREELKVFVFFIRITNQQKLFHTHHVLITYFLHKIFFLLIFSYIFFLFLFFVFY
jgi:hypothetical protein